MDDFPDMDAPNYLVVKDSDTFRINSKPCPINLAKNPTNISSLVDINTANIPAANTTSLAINCI